ncbi:NAD(P)/FAD-dependent oxidoreductase (plasmid) [Glutamicibacter soli]|uniref:NAD(P)/FAD-dependent oxidoreductase n=1 Tax=Glutamicibacter soli TaxID=453836 RepID=UPI003C721223
MKIAVIGAGVIGVSIATELLSRGATVSLVDMNAPGSGTSATSFAWVNSNNKHPQHYYELNLAGVRAHHDLAARGGEWFHPTGHVEVAVDHGHQQELRGRLERLAGLGYEAEVVGAQRMRELIPDLKVPGHDPIGAFYPREAHIDPALYIKHMLAQAISLGVSVQSPAKVINLTPTGQGCQVELDNGTTLEVDRVVTAAGRWTNEITELAGLPQVMAETRHAGDATMGYLAITSPVSASMGRVLTSPLLNARPGPDGSLVLQALDLDATAETGTKPGNESELAAEFLRRLNGILAHTEDVRITDIQVAQRAIPADALSVIGSFDQAPWAYVVATHSGVTLAPFLGKQVAEEILGGHEPLFEPFRPERLVSASPLSPLAAPRRPGEQ